MDFDKIDWNAMWQEAVGFSHWDNSSSKELWDKRADSFTKRINRVKDGEPRDKDDYISKMLDRIEVKPDWTVLDIGCGPGTLALPLAEKVKSITALDISPQMLKNLQVNADKAGLNNINYLNMSYQDAFKENKVGVHDVVVASRSMTSGDMAASLRHIIAITRQAAYITFPVVHLPFDFEVYQAISRTRKKHAPYIYVANMLYQMGVNANIEVLFSKVKVQFPSIEEAMDDLQWRTDPFTPEEKAKLRHFLEEQFAGQPDAPPFTHEGKSQWALIWWRKENRFSVA